MERLSFPKNSLYLVTDSGLSLGRPLSFIVEQSIDGGVSVIQYREKNFQYNVHLKEAEKLRLLCKNRNVTFLVNDRVDLAQALDADGVHLGQSDMPVEIARGILGDHKIIGWSIESLKDFQSFITSPSLNTSIDYLALSPIFPTSTKSDTIGSWGLDGIMEIRSKTQLPLVAIGGINETNIASIHSRGADSIAVVTAISSAKDPKLATQTLLNKMKKSG